MGAVASTAYRRTMAALERKVMPNIVLVCTSVCALLFGIARATATEPITIGFGMALTGNIAANGRAALIAMKLWEEDINKAGGLLGRPVKLIYYDDQSTPPNIPGLYTKLLDLDKVDIVVSGYGTNMTVPAMPVVMAHNRMFMTLFALGVNADFKYSNSSGCCRPARLRVPSAPFPRVCHPP